MNDKEQLEKIKRKMVSTLIYLTRLPEKYASEVIDQILAIPEIEQALGLLEKKDNLCASCDTPLMNEVEMEDKEPTEAQIKVKKLVKWVAETMYYRHVTSSFKGENECQWFRDKYIKYAKQILSHPDLALMVEKDCGCLQVEIDYGHLIPLAEVLKEMDDGTKTTNKT